MNRTWQQIADAFAKALRPEMPNERIETSEEVGLINQLARLVHKREPMGAAVAFTSPTERILLEIIEHEGIVLEYYLDSVGVGTWGIGVTNASGHKVKRYKDNPQTVKRCLEVYEWLLRTKYLPEVLGAFGGRPLSENELGAALSFHWNTGAIDEAQWVRDVLAGRTDAARLAIMNWSTPREIIGRRKCERDLFFDGKWTSDGHVTIYDVDHRTYKPDWGSARQIDIRPELARVIAAVKAEAAR